MSPRRRSDHWTRKAREQSYPARSVYKLEEIDGRLKLLRRGQKVLDLGCAPGSWLMYASKRVGPRGSVTGVDLSQITIRIPENATVLQADVNAIDTDRIRPPDGFDVVLSDMAPSTTGASLVDQERSFELFQRALEIAFAALRPRGSFLGKLFQSPHHQEVLESMKGRFTRVRTLRPRATRSSSREVFVAGMEFGT